MKAITTVPTAVVEGPLQLAERALFRLVATVSALLLTAIIALLFTGVVSRYVFHVPITWSDELCSILFLWLAMLGASLATQQASHMRMTALVSMLGERWSSFFASLSLATGLAFLLLVLGPAYHYASEEAFVTSSALEISNAWRASAIPLGVALMICFSLFRLIEIVKDKQAVAAIALVGLAVLVFWLFGSNLKGAGYINLVIFFVGVVSVAVFAGVPIAFAFALATFGYLALTTRVPMLTLVGRMDEGMSHLMLLAVPTFIFLGQLLEMTGMARAMIQCLASLLGHIRGGLSYVLVGAMYLVSGISGSKAADMAAIAPALFPEMIKRGAKPGELVALLSATGAQTETVPPSIVLITVGSVASVSIAALFTGGLVPALVLGIFLCVVVGYRYRKEDLSGVARASKKDVLKLSLVAAPAIALPFVIRAAVVEGVATATEVSTIGILYSIFVGLALYRQFDWRRLGPMLVETVILSGAILLIIGAASAMAWALTQSGFSRELAEFMKGLPGGKNTFMVVSILAFIVLGSVLEGIPAIVLFGPLLFPIARALGIHEVHYAMVVVLSMGLGLFAPPFGVGYYSACAIGNVDPDEGIRPIWGYMLALFLGLVLVAVFPWLSIGFLKD
ncbi:TRAP transporter large permease subunit [Variovorax paradoxus]|uniref:TRAP transporter large permease subunit n=1 Tax=Variovorax paradoxus TaxID=34073 RepID=A0A5Q0MDQ1_VARPD|nr:TRAP transporter large permease subunit [Variovorax paradoxus]QFZ87649.1 TRAP transporter large permease subunit [Variovorax paradoxus]